MTSSPDAPDVPLLPREADFDVSPEDFNPATWLNHVLQPPDAPSLETLLDQTSDALRHTHIELDASLKAALNSIPWVVRETERIRQRANHLRTNVDGVGERVAGVESGVVSSVKTIADADFVVRRVQNTADLLSTATKVERLQQRLDALLASSRADGADLVTAADVVSQLRTALRPLAEIDAMRDHFSRLERADQSLEKLAAPQLLSALESRNTAAAVNARIVFDHAGRDNAFRAQYIALRGRQVRAVWDAAWTTNTELGEDVEAEGSRGDLAGVGALTKIDKFYEDVYALVVLEAKWLLEAFPDLRDILLPGLICEAMRGLKEPSPTVGIPDIKGTLVGESDELGERIYAVAKCAIMATARIVGALLPEGFDISSDGDIEDETDEEKLVAASDSVTALLMPHQQFWKCSPSLAVRYARARAHAVPLDMGPKRPGLGDLARHVEGCTQQALELLDACLGNVNIRTCGAGIDAMKQACSAAARVLSDRLLKVLRRGGEIEDEWTRIGGALRLLCATASLKRAWDGRKESAFAVAIGTATPVLEAAAMRQSVGGRVQGFLRLVAAGKVAEAGVVWELGREERAARQVISEFESLDATNDFQGLLDAVHRVVYDTMFHGVVERFNTFNSDGWKAMGEGDGGMVGFSNSPLAYATEVAEYLMTIPQQLEPFVPEEEDAKYATPRSTHMFLREAVEEGEDEDLSFAGMWLSTLTMGMMELYVEKICCIDSVSTAGARQLATDADYISNVVASLGVPPTPQLSLVRRLLEAPATALASETPSTPGLRKIARRVAAVRGVSMPV